MSTVSWIHISDFHFQSGGDKFSQEQVCHALLESVQGVVEAGLSLAFAAVTGDVAFSGQHSEYIEAKTFFHELASVTGIRASDFYFVPGNHDVDRTVHELAHRGGLSTITSSERVDYYIADERIQPLIQRQAGFWSFVDDFTSGQQRQAVSSGLGYVSSVEYSWVKFCILGLNSAWLSGSDNEDRNLVMGERQVIDAISAARALSPHYMIALAHHPLTWLAEWDAEICEARLLRAVDIFLRGHLHTNAVSLTSSPEYPCIEIAAGSGHATRFYGNAYNIISIDLSAGTCSVQVYKYDPKLAKFEATEAVAAPITVPGSIPGTRADLAEAIASAVLGAAPFSGFMAGLLTDQLGEVPILKNGKVSFVLPTAAHEVESDESLSPMTKFLGLRNLLRLGAPTVSLEDRVAANVPAIVDYANSLAAMTETDPSCRARLQGHQQALSRAPRRVGGHRWSLSLFDAYRRDEDWAGLEFSARNLATSPDRVTSRHARSALAEALMHSEEAQKRLEAFVTASELASADDASTSEIVLAAAAAEASHKAPEAAFLVIDTLRAGRSSPQLIDYAQGLAMRIGSLEIRELAEQALRDSTERGEK